MDHLDFGKQLQAQSDLLRPFALRLTRDPERARDLVQDSLLKAYLNRNKFRAGTDLKAWIRTVAKNTFLDQCRHLKRARHLEHDLETHEGTTQRAHSADDPLAVYQAKELRIRINALPAGLRATLLLHSEGYKYEEIAGRLAIPVGTVKSRIHVARRHLTHRHELKD